MKIASVEAFPVRLARPRATGTAGSPTSLVPGASAYRWSETVPALYSENFETALVKVTLDSGLTGWGEAQAPLAPEVACEIVRLLLAPVLEGTAFDGAVETIATIWARMYQTMRVRGQTGGFMLDAISGIDLALWDLAGQIAQQPVSQLIRPDAPARVPAYLSGVPGESIDDCVAAATRALEQGFTTFKLFHDRTETDLLDRLAALSKLPGARIAVDGLWRFDEASALAFGRELDRLDALWFECPLPPEDARAHARLARAIRTPLAIGESYRTRAELAPFFEQRAMTIVQPDLGRCGITEFLHIAAMASEAGVRVMPHVSIALGPQLAAAIHVAAACHCELLEFNPNVLTVANEFLEHPLTLDAAAYLVPAGLGLGVKMDRAFLE